MASDPFAVHPFGVLPSQRRRGLATWLRAILACSGLAFAAWSAALVRAVTDPGHPRTLESAVFGEIGGALLLALALAAVTGAGLRRLSSTAPERHEPHVATWVAAAVLLACVVVLAAYGGRLALLMNEG